MSEADALVSASEIASDLISDVFEAFAFISRSEAATTSKKQFIEELYSIESRRESLERLLIDCGSLFSRTTSKASPVQFNGLYFASVHDAILHIGRGTDFMMFDIMKSEHPNLYKDGVEYLCPKLCNPDDLLTHFEIAAHSFVKHFPSEEQLNSISAAREIELCQAINLCMDRIPPVLAQSKQSQGKLLQVENERTALAELIDPTKHKMFNDPDFAFARMEYAKDPKLAPTEAARKYVGSLTKFKRRQPKNNETTIANRLRTKKHLWQIPPQPS